MNCVIKGQFTKVKENDHGMVIFSDNTFVKLNGKIYLKPKVTLHFELPNISLLFLILTKLNIAISCLYPP